MAVPSTGFPRALAALYTWLATFDVTAGTVTASKALVADANKDLATLRAVTATRFLGNLRIARGAAVAAAGSVQGDATQLLEGFQVVTGADATKGVLLPVAVAGMLCIIKGTTAAVLKVWPATGAAINAIAANGSISVASLAPVIFIADSTTQWFTIPLLPS